MDAFQTQPIQSAAAASGSAPLAAQDSSPPIVSEKLTRRFGDLVAVNAVSIALRRGEIFGLIGSNGAGKSTLIKILITLLPPTSGRARVAGYDIVTQATEVRRRIGYVPQLLSADGSLTGYENMLMSARLYAIAYRERSQRIAHALAMMNLSEVAGKLVREYSGGMIRRLEIAQSMLHRPGVLVMDEPTTGLDPVARRAVWEHIRGLSRKFGTTILLTTHDMKEAEELCGRIALMHRGVVEIAGSPAELKAQAGSGATLDDVFAHFTGVEIEPGGGYRETRRSRRGARQHA